jgi:cytidylate kinase
MNAAGSSAPSAWRGRGAQPAHRRDLLRRDDSEQADRMRYLYEADLADTAPYDVVVNSEKLRYEAAVESLLSRR